MTTLKQKILLIVGGILLSLILIEVGLRLGGSGFLYVQDQHNKQRLRSASNVTVLCLGESTTALGGDFSYPHQLEGILNQAGGQRTFAVINKGIPATNSSIIVQQLENNLRHYRPDIVVVMMGINDTEDTPLLGSDKNISRTGFQFKTVNLGKLLWENLLRKFSSSGSANPEPRTEENSNKPPQELIPILKAQTMLALSKNPNDPNLHIRLAFLGYWAKDYPLAIQESKAASTLLSPKDGLRLSLINLQAKCFWEMGHFDLAEQIYQQLFFLSQQNVDRFIIYEDLIYLALAQENPAKAEEYLWRQIPVAENHALSFRSISSYYRNHNQQKERVRFLQALCDRIPPDNPQLYKVLNELGRAYLRQEQYQQAETVFSLVWKSPTPIPLHTKRRAAMGLSTALRKQGQTEASKEIVREIAQSYYLPTTIKNFQALAEMVLRNQAVLVCVQYPKRPLAPLAALFPSHKKIFFVDNEQAFMDAVSELGFDNIFEDRFAVDFGHCTPQGNSLLAKNIARVILDEVLAPPKKFSF